MDKHLTGCQIYCPILIVVDKESDIADLEEVTLGQVLTYGLHNDLGFRVGDRLLILVEAQSTWSVNIIVRCMLYMANTIQEYLVDSEQSLFGSKPVHLPEPELYVLFSGDTPKIEKKEITLSEEFFGGKKTDLDVRVHVLTGENEGDIIYEYVVFTEKLARKPPPLRSRWGMNGSIFTETHMMMIYVITIFCTLTFLI